MNGLKKTLNVLGIILAWILSIALVVLLTAAPVALSALSLLTPQTITEAVFDALEGAEPSAAAPAEQKSYGVASLSAKKTTESDDTLLEDLDVGRIEQIIGAEIDEDVLQKVLASDAVKEIVEAYVGDVADAITGKTGKERFNAEKIIEVVEDNIDEIADVIQEVAPDLSKDDIKELKKEIKTVVRENAADIVKEIPAPEDIRDAVAGDGEGGELVLALLAQLDTFKLIIVGAIVLLSLLIFLLRLPGFRGLRWLSVDLFTAGGFSAAICVVLHLSSSLAMGIAEGFPELDFLAVNDVVRSVLSSFTKGVTVRTLIILVAAILLMAAYILIKVLGKKKPAAPAAPVAVEPVAAEFVGETAPEQQNMGE